MYDCSHQRSFQCSSQGRSGIETKRHSRICAMSDVAPCNPDALLNSQRRSKNRHAATEKSQISCSGEMCWRDSAGGWLGCETFAKRLRLVRLFQGIVDGD